MSKLLKVAASGVGSVCIKNYLEHSNDIKKRHVLKNQLPENQNGATKNL